MISILISCACVICVYANMVYLYMSDCVSVCVRVCMYCCNDMDVWSYWNALLFDARASPCFAIFTKGRNYFMNTNEVLFCFLHMQSMSCTEFLLVFFLPKRCPFGQKREISHCTRNKSEGQFHWNMNLFICFIKTQQFISICV